MIISGWKERWGKGRGRRGRDLYLGHEPSKDGGEFNIYYPSHDHIQYRVDAATINLTRDQPSRHCNELP